MQVWSRLIKKCGLYRANKKRVNGPHARRTNYHNISPAGLWPVELKINYLQFKLFSYKAVLSMNFFLLINIKIVGILISIKRKIFVLNQVEHEKSFLTLGPPSVDHGLTVEDIVV